MIARACSWCCGDLRPADTQLGPRLSCMHCGRLPPEKNLVSSRMTGYGEWLGPLRRSGGFEALMEKRQTSMVQIAEGVVTSAGIAP